MRGVIGGEKVKGTLRGVIGGGKVKVRPSMKREVCSHSMEY